jgi:predicted transcriptional regulator
MASKSRTRYLSLSVDDDNFIWKFIGRGEESFNHKDIFLLRQLLSKERARILYLLKTKKPKSIYQLAKFAGRNFKSVSQDINLLEKFGFVEFHLGKTGKRQAKTPILAIDQLNIVLSL